jgi:hypothetical protein
MAPPDQVVNVCLDIGQPWRFHVIIRLVAAELRNECAMTGHDPSR